MPQAVQNGSTDAVLGVEVKHHFLFGIVFADGVEESQNAGMNQVVYFNLNRQIVANAVGDSLHQRQVFYDQRVALFSCSRDRC